MKQALMMAVDKFNSLFDTLHPYQKKEIFKLLLKKAVLGPEGIKIALFGKYPQIGLFDTAASDGAIRCQTSIWLRNPETKRTIRSAKLKIPVFLQFVNQKLAIVEGIPPYGLKTNRRITRALLKETKPVIRKPSSLEEAYKYAEVYREPSVASMAQIGRRFGVSRARVCQILNLLELDEKIQKYLFSLKDIKEHNFFTERRLRQIAIIRDKSEQISKFGKLVDDMKFELKNRID